MKQAHNKQSSPAVNDLLTGFSRYTVKGLVIMPDGKQHEISKTFQDMPNAYSEAADYYIKEVASWANFFDLMAGSLSICLTSDRKGTTEKTLSINSQQFNG